MSAVDIISTNPVSEFYKSYEFNKNLPIISCSNYEDVLNKAKSVNSSCILYNKTKNTVSDKNITINCSFDKSLEVILLLNVDLTGKSSVKIQGKNYSVSNISLLDGDKSYAAPEHIVDISAESVKVINLSMINFKCKDSDKDYIRVRESAKNFHLYNSMLDGKSCNGVFLRLDLPLNNYIKCCVVRNIQKGNTDNGGEGIRLATSSYESKDAFCVIDQCYFNNCRNDPEVVSIKCSSNTVKNCIFENNGTSKLVLRHSHKDIIDTCYFSGSGMRCYGTKHNMKNIQLVNDANILLDDKKGGGYVVAEDITVDTVYHDNVKTPVTNDGKNCKVTNVTKGLKITKDMLLSNNVIPPPPPPSPVSDVEIIPSVVDVNKKYVLNKDLTEQQLKDLMS